VKVSLLWNNKRKTNVSITPNRLDDGFTIFSIFFRFTADHIHDVQTDVTKRLWVLIIFTKCFPIYCASFVALLFTSQIELPHTTSVCWSHSMQVGFFQFSIFLHRRHGNFLSRGVSRLVTSCIITTDSQVPFELSGASGGFTSRLKWSVNGLLAQPQ